MKATVTAPTNVAVIKYWGKQPGGERLPTNTNLALVVDSVSVTTTVEFSDLYAEDTFTLYKNAITDSAEIKKLSAHLGLIRSLAGTKLFAKVVSDGNVPPSCGFSSSAAGFAALTLAAAEALRLKLSEAELSVLARRGSGSASRSIPKAGGLVQWHYAQTSAESFAETIAPAWPDLCIVAVVVSRDKKYLPTTQGQKGAQTSPFFAERLKHIDAMVAAIQQAYDQRDFTAFGHIAEQEALELHAIMMTQDPPCLYLHPNTVKVMQTVQRDWREKQGLEVYFTVNTGQNPWLLVREQDLARLTAELDKLPEIQDYIINHIGHGARVSNQYLF